MRILFLTLLDFDSLEDRNIYTDLLREFINHGHSVCVISPVERRTGRKTELIKERQTRILKLQIGNVQKTNLIEKGISTITLEDKFIAGIKKYFYSIRFDLVLYSTPPITFCRAVEFVKKRDNAITYLLLKDIFPQNAVDIGIMSKSGLKSLLYKFFRWKEKKLYAVSDFIGCMSLANVDYVLKNNPEIRPDIVEVCPNSVEVVDMRVNTNVREEMRMKYGIPLDKMVFVYGGNLGKPQGIPFLTSCLQSQMTNSRAYFLIVGDGTEYGRLEAFFEKFEPENMKLMKRLPKEDYERMVAACDVGMIFLDHRFTIPNFPSRLLSYMQAGLPVLCCTDPNTDIGKVVVEGGFGWWCESNDVKGFHEVVNRVLSSELKNMGSVGFDYLKVQYSSSKGYETVMKAICKCKIQD